jgi:hypothetical protein
LGSLVVSLVGAWGACGGRGERRRDGVPVFSAHGQLDIHEAPRSNHIETRGAFLVSAALSPREARGEAIQATRRYEGTKFGSQNHRRGKFRMSAPLTRFYPNRDLFTRI